MSDRKWLHAASVSSSKGKTKLYCSCGWQSEPVLHYVSSVLYEDHKIHTGLIEKRPRITN